MKNIEDFLKEHPEAKLKNNISKEEKYKKLEEFDNAKTKVLKYVLYKKRTEKEIRQKFSSSMESETLDDIIENLKQNGYIDDESYIKKAVNEFMALKTLSNREIRNKLYEKGINSDIIDTYFANNEEILEQYEINCAKKIILKKQTQLEKDEIEIFLRKKGYQSECIKIAFEEVE